MFQWPLDKKYIVQGFGERPAVYKQFNMKGHNGLDFRTRFIDSPLGRRYVTAVTEGIIEEIRYDIRGYGIHIRQRLPDGSLCIYAHLTKPYIQLKSSVKQGQRIGLTGNTGFSSGPHLHFDWRPAPIDYKNGYNGCRDVRAMFPA